MKPTVGRIVHYTSLGDRDGKYPPEIQAAMVTKVTFRPPPVDEPRKDAEVNYQVSLLAFYPTGQFAMLDVEFTSEAAGTEAARGKWAWPARE
jgi:hypothetical protein